MIFAGVITGMLLAAFAALLMAIFYERGKQVGFIKGVAAGKKLFETFKENELDYVLKKDLPVYLAGFVDDDGNELSEWYPILIVKPDATTASLSVDLKGE